ncbi:MAG: hypothetical protein ACEQSB_06800 [Undibacterium sp.]
MLQRIFSSAAGLGYSVHPVGATNLSPFIAILSSRVLEENIGTISPLLSFIIIATRIGASARLPLNVSINKNKSPAEKISNFEKKKDILIAIVYKRKIQLLQKAKR